MEVQINNSDHLEDFVRLNNEWIERYFVLENGDRLLAKNPRSIIESGGYIFSIFENDSVVAVCALLKKEKGYELARMAVADSAKGKGYGNLLMDSALQKCKELNLSKIQLYSNTKLEAAICLYKKYGFVSIYEGQHPDYARCNIIMERAVA